MADKRTILIELLTDSAIRARCRYCGAAIRWATTRAHNKMPLDDGAEIKRDESGKLWVDSAQTHWSTCPEQRRVPRRQK